MSDKAKKDEFNNIKIDFEAKQNLVGFFSLLLEIDKRNNPKKYKNNENKIKC